MPIRPKVSGRKSYISILATRLNYPFLKSKARSLKEGSKRVRAKARAFGIATPRRKGSKVQPTLKVPNDVIMYFRC